MAISNNSKRIQLTFNEEKEKEKVVLDYLANSFSDINEIKRILYEYVINQSDVKAVVKPKSKPKVATKPRSKSEVVKVIESDNKLLTSTKNESEIVKSNESDNKVVKDNTNDTNEDITLDLSSFDNKQVEVKISENKNNELELLKQNEMDELSKFMP